MNILSLIRSLFPPRMVDIIELAAWNFDPEDILHCLANFCAALLSVTQKPLHHFQFGQLFQITIQRKDETSLMNKLLDCHDAWLASSHYYRVCKNYSLVLGCAFVIIIQRSVDSAFTKKLLDAQDTGLASCARSYEVARNWLLPDIPISNMYVR